MTRVCSAKECHNEASVVRVLTIKGKHHLSLAHFRCGRHAVKYITAGSRRYPATIMTFEEFELLKVKAAL